MKFLKKILFVLLTILLIFLVIPLFMETDFKISRSVHIKESKMVVFQYLKYLKNQEKYGVWNKRDPDTEKSYQGTDGQIGFTYIWDSQNENVGKGEQEIVGINEYDNIEHELRFQRPWESTNKAWFDIVGNQDSTTVTWSIQGSVPYPLNFFNLFTDLDGMIGKDLVEGLENLKIELTKKEFSGSD